MVDLLIKVKRVYAPVAAEDGFRILVDRLWPRGMSKEKAKLDLWLKDIAPSEALRQWFSHNPDNWQDFQQKYQQELPEKKELLDQIKQLEKKHGTVTLIYSARDLEHNNALVLEKYLKNSIT